MYGGYVCITHLQVKSFYNVNQSHLTKLPSSLGFYRGISRVLIIDEVQILHRVLFPFLLNF